MKLDNVFVAFLKKDNKEHLIYKKEDNLYFDLENKESYNDMDIDLDTLIYFKETLKEIINQDKKNMLKNNIKKIYNKDREKLINLSSLYILGIYKVNNLSKKRINSDTYEYNWKSEYLYKTLLEKIGECSYQDIRNNRLYYGRKPCNLYNGIIYADDKEDIIQLYEKKVYISSIKKKKVLELAYKVSKNKEI